MKRSPNRFLATSVMLMAGVLYPRETALSEAPIPVEKEKPNMTREQSLGFRPFGPQRPAQTVPEQACGHFE